MAWKNVQYENGKYQTASGGGGGGASNLSDLDDTNISSPTNGQVLKYNGTSSKWENASGGGGGGASILFGTTFPTSQQGSDGDLYVKYRTGLGLTALFGKISGEWNPLNLFAEYAWDFTKSLTSINNGTDVVLSGATRTASGIVLSGSYDYIRLPSSLIKPNYTFEITIDSLSVQSPSNNNRLFMFHTDSGLVWRGATGKWGVWDSSNNWQESNITDKNYFDDCVLKIVIDGDYKWHIYKDDTLVFEPPNAITSYYTTSELLTIGANGNGCYNVTISALTAYPNNV